MHPTLGPRICIIGPSSSGKSTLANRLARTYGLTPVHLDQLYHQPTGNWVARPWDEFVALHDAAITGERWVIEGNYKRTLPQRFDRATAILDVRLNRFVSLYRFIRRYVHTKAGGTRYGQPDQLDEKFNWAVVWWILQPASLNPKRRQGFKDLKALLRQHAHKVTVIRSFQDMDRLVNN